VRSRHGQGQFVENIDPQDPTGAAAGVLLRSMSGDPGLRLAAQMSARHRRYYGTAVTPQRFVKPPGGTNTEEALDVVHAMPLKRNRQRAMGQIRGLPWMSNGAGEDGL
jgi:hypothetical protein